MQIFHEKKHSNFFRSKHHQKLHNQKDMSLIYKQDFYKDKQKEIYELLMAYLATVMEYLDHPDWIENGDKILMLLLIKKSKSRCKVTIN